MIIGASPKSEIRIPEIRKKTEIRNEFSAVLKK